MNQLGQGTAPRRIAIVGAGISGLAAAWTMHLRLPKTQLTVFESADRAGGVLETIYDAPYLVERSADNFATLIPDALDLCKATGYLDELISPEQNGRQAFVLNRGRVLPIPAGFSLVQPTRLWPILTTRTLSVAGKIRLLSELIVPPRSDDADESLQSFATRRLGRNAFENLVEPIVSGIFTADPSKLSMQATLPQFVKMEREHGGLIRGYLAARRENAAAVSRRASGARYDQFVAPRHGMTHWIKHLVESLPPSTIRFNQTVLSVQRVLRASPEPHPTNTRSTWRVKTSTVDEHFDGLIMAAPTHHAARLLQPSEPEIAERLSKFDYASSAVVILVVDRQHVQRRVDGFGLIVPSIERSPVLAISYSSNKYAGRAPDDQLMMRIFFGGAKAPEMLQRSDAALIAAAEAQIREILGWQGQACRWQGVARWHNAMPQYHIGHNARVAELQQLVAQLGGLRLCGNAYSGVGIPQTVRSGRQAAQELADELDPAVSQLSR